MMTRGEFLKRLGRWCLLGGMAFGMIRLSGGKKRAQSLDAPAGVGTLWQIDPTRCIQCGKCETHCVLTPSAIKCVHQYVSCGYCLFCSGYYQDHRVKFDTAGENLRCPTDAIIRTYIEDPYFEYQIDEERCNGCGKCVKGCSAFGNGSLFLQVRQNLCRHCNQCSVAQACPSRAFVRVEPESPYLFRRPEVSG